MLISRRIFKPMTILLIGASAISSCDNATVSPHLLLPACVLVCLGLEVVGGPDKWTPSSDQP